MLNIKTVLLQGMRPQLKWVMVAAGVLFSVACCDEDTSDDIETGNDGAWIGSVISTFLVVGLWIGCGCYCYKKCCNRTRVVAAGGVGNVVVNNVNTAPPSQPNVIQNINMIQQPAQMQFPSFAQPQQHAAQQPWYGEQPFFAYNRPSGIQLSGNQPSGIQSSGPSAPPPYNPNY